MNKIAVLLATAAMCIAAPALATNPNDPGPLPGCAPSGNTPPKCDTPTPTPTTGPIYNGGTGGAGGNGGAGGAGGNGGAGGTGIGVGVGIAGAEANSSSNASASALAAQTQGQQQGQIATGGNASSLATGGDSSSLATGGNSNATGGNSNATGGTGGNSVAQGGNSGGNTLQNVTNYKRAFRIAPMAVAPTMIAGDCQKSRSFALSTPFGGVASGKTNGYKFCELLKLRGVAHDMQLSTEFQCAILSQDKRWARAMKSAGETCATKVIVETPDETMSDEEILRAGENG